MPARAKPELAEHLGVHGWPNLPSPLSNGMMSLETVGSAGTWPGWIQEVGLHAGNLRGRDGGALPT